MKENADFLLWNGLREANADKVRGAIEMGANTAFIVEQDIPSQGLEAGDTALHAAFKPNMNQGGRRLNSIDVSEVVGVLLDHCALAQSINAKGYTPLMLACDHEKLKVNASTLGKLIAASKPVVNHLGSGTSALHLAARKRGAGWAKRLLAAGADAALLDGQGANALWPVLDLIDGEHLHANAKTSGFWKVVDALVAGGVDINQVNVSGRTPAMAYQRIPIEEMVARGVDLTLEVNGKSVLSESLDALETGRRHPMYLIPTLERLAQTTGIDWTIKSLSSGRSIKEVLSDMTAGQYYEEGRAVLAMIDRHGLDETTALVGRTSRTPRL